MARINGKFVPFVVRNVGSVPTQTKKKTITANGTTHVTPDAGKTLSDVEITVNVPIPTPSYEEKTVNVTANGSRQITPSSGYDGISKVNLSVNVPTATAKKLKIATNAIESEIMVTGKAGSTTIDKWINSRGQTINSASPTIPYGGWVKSYNSYTTKLTGTATIRDGYTLSHSMSMQETTDGSDTVLLLTVDVED